MARRPALQDRRPERLARGFSLLQTEIRRLVVAALVRRPGRSGLLAMRLRSRLWSPRTRPLRTRIAMPVTRRLTARTVARLNGDPSWDALEDRPVLGLMEMCFRGRSPVGLMAVLPLVGSAVRTVAATCRRSVHRFLARRGARRLGRPVRLRTSACASASRGLGGTIRRCEGGK